MEHTTPHASDGINLLTASGNKRECVANCESLQQANHPSENEASDATNPFNSGEFEAIRKLDKEVLGRLKEEDAGNLCGQNGPSSDATNALTSREIKAIHKHYEQSVSHSEKVIAGNASHALNPDLLQLGETGKQGTPMSGKATRSSHALNESIATRTRSRKQIRLPERCRPGIARARLRLNTKSLKQVSVRAMGSSVTNALHTTGEEVVLAQSQCDYGFKLQVRSLYQNRGIAMELIFDPSSDVLLLCNIAGLIAEETIAIKQLPVTPQSITAYIENKGFFALNVSSYGIYMSNEHILDMDILPRRYISSLTEPRSQSRGTNKRAFEASSPQQDSKANKRAKLKETSEEPSDSTLFQTAPTHPLVDEPAAARSLSSVSNSGISCVSELRRHPLEELELGDTVKIVCANEEEDYELTRRADLSVQRNSLVYKASCSKIPEVVVVKIWRSKLDFDADSPPSAMNVSSVGKYWLNEVKIHSEIGKHHAIAAFLGADARFLSIHLEFVNAPNLVSYCDRRPNAYCKLDYSDARRVLYSIADALNFIHEKGIAHDDVKPANILYSKDRGPVLIDFGWSSKRSSAVVGHCAGSPWYIPPEYQKGGGRGPPGDVFAFGVVMLFLLGQIPLPELQSPLLTWQISHLRKLGPDARTAVREMDKWLKIVQVAASKLDESPGIVSDKYIGGIVWMIQDMLKFRPKERITSHDLFRELRRLRNPNYMNINFIQQD